METGIDIFATKGIEYALVLIYLVFFVGYWLVLNRTRPVRVARKLAPVTGLWKELAEGFELRPNLAYHPAHTWAQGISEGRYRVGIDDFASKLLDQPIGVTLPQPGDALKSGQTAWHLSVLGEDIPIVSPLAGNVVRVNERLLDDPGMIAQQPYDEGWVLELDVADSREPQPSLLHGRRARAWLKDSIDRLLGGLGTELGPVLADGGTLMAGLARQIAAESWRTLAFQFLGASEQSESIAEDRSAAKDC